MSVLELDKISYTYDGKVYVFKDFSCTFEKGKVYAIVGRSGAGKTTLLSLLAGLDKLSGGRILFEGNDITKIDKYKYRSNEVGVVFQSYNLLPKFTARENVELSIDLSKRNIPNKKEVSLEMLKKVGLSEEEANRRVLKISGGQQQRVAIARAIAYEPSILLADEPTGNLDPETQDAIMDIFKSIAHDDNKCVIIVTNSRDVADEADVVYELKNNKKEKERRRRRKKRDDSEVKEAKEEHQQTMTDKKAEEAEEAKDAAEEVKVSADKKKNALKSLKEKKSEVDTDEEDADDDDDDLDDPKEEAEE